MSSLADPSFTAADSTTTLRKRIEEIARAVRTERRSAAASRDVLLDLNTANPLAITDTALDAADARFNALDAQVQDLEQMLANAQRAESLVDAVERAAKRMML